MKHNTLYFVYKKIYDEITLARFKSLWRKNNVHNLTVPMNVWPKDKVVVGKYTYGNLNCLFFGTKDNSEFIKIGNSCSIANDTKFIAGGEHQIDTLTTYPYIQKYIDKNSYSAYSKGPIIVEDDVWIGRGCTILSGVKIGKGAVIGCGSIVTRDIAPYAVVAGIPAKTIKYRFPLEVIDILQNLDYSDLELDIVRENIDIFTEVLDSKNVYKISDKIRKIVSSKN